MKKIIAIILLFSLLLVGCKEDVPELIKPVNSSSVYYTVTSDTISSKTVYDGKVTPETEVVFAAVSGYAYEVNYKPGDVVSEGDVLYLINEDIDSEISSLAAEITQFATISNLYVKQNDNEIANMKKNLATKNGMDKELYELDIELKEYEHSVAESERAEELVEKQAYYDELLLKQANSKIIAPCSGTIVSMGVFCEGDYIEEEVIACIIAKEDTKYFEVENLTQSILEEADTVSLQVGNLIIDNPEFIKFSSEEIEYNSFNTDCMYLQVSDEYYDSVELGQYCAVSITYNTKENILYVPNECIFGSASEAGKYCLVLNENNKEERISVTTGTVTDYYTEIVSGLTEGQMVYYGTDATNWNSEVETTEVKLGSFTHTTIYTSAGKNAQQSEIYKIGYPGKINQIFISESYNVPIVEGQELFTVIGEVKESVYEQAKLDYENAVSTYDDSIESYDEMIETKKDIMANNALDSVEYIIADYELGILNNEREAYIAELDRNIEELYQLYSTYEKAKNGEEITITAPASGTLDMIYTLITNAEVSVDTNYCIISQPESYVVQIYDSVSDTESGLLAFGNNVTVSSKNPLTGETLLVAATAVGTNNTIPQFSGQSTLQLNDLSDAANIYDSTATAYFTDIEISNVCVVGTSFLGYEGSGSNRKAYVNLQTEGGVIKRYVEIEAPSEATGNVWIKNGLEVGDIIVK